MDNYFQELYSRNVNEHVESKGKFKYLSWTYAVAELNKLDPQASWEVIRFNGMPFLSTECGYFVEVAVTVKGITKSQIHPVLDNNNRPIEKPNAFQINTSIQRCLVKAIALHGLGLYIYAGEDLPESTTQPEKQEIDYAALLQNCTTPQELMATWQTIPKAKHRQYASVKDEMKTKLKAA